MYMLREILPSQRPTIDGSGRYREKRVCNCFDIFRVGEGLRKDECIGDGDGVHRCSAESYEV